MLDLHRDWFAGIENKIANIFAILPFSPNQYTSLSIIAALAMLLCFLVGNYWLGLIFFAIAAAMDFIDGAVARKKNLSTNKGAYWDTVADRYVEAFLLFGLLFAGLPDFYLSAGAWIFLAFFGSMMTTYAKAAAGEKRLINVELKGGLMSRAERLVVYAAIIVLLNYNLYLVSILLAFLAILTNITAWQRIGNALKTN